MDAALEQVERHCGAQLSGYSSCIDAKPETWLVDCAHLKHHLTQCARTHSLLVGALKERCAPQIEQYERCLKANADEPTTCQPHLRRLWDCSDQQAEQHR